MNTSDVLELLVDRYAAVAAPAPSRELAARMDAGWIGSADDDRGAVVVPFVTRPRVRIRYLAAALVATFVAMSGLAAAGALPDPIQRGVASIVSHLGIDLPTPEPTSTPAPSGAGGGHPSSNGSSPAGGSAPVGSSGSGAGPSSEGSSPAPASTTVPGVGALGDLGTPPTVPPTTLPPPLDVPQLTDPPLTAPQPTVPPLTVPSVTLGPIAIALPPLELPGL